MVTCMFVFLAVIVGVTGCTLAKEWDTNAYADTVIPGVDGNSAIVESEAPAATQEPEITQPEESNPPTEEVATPQATTPPPVLPGKDGNDKKKLIALTFDDGPDSKYTSQILDILAENNVKATFFLVGLQVAKYPEVAKRIVDEGHTIGNHSWSHSDLSKLPAKARDKEIDKTQQAILDATGVMPQLMRAPYGAISDSVLKSIHEQDMKHVYWTIDTRDWAGTSVADMHKNVLKNTHSGAIILMHSFGGRKHALEHTVKLLPTIITELREKGYEFVTVDEMIKAGAAYASVVK
jgi:polysaccharide deacetylase family sporulation protein PdaB